MSGIDNHTYPCNTAKERSVNAGCVIIDGRNGSFVSNITLVNKSGYGHETPKHWFGYHCVNNTVSGVQNDKERQFRGLIPGYKPVLALHSTIVARGLNVCFHFVIILII